MIATLEIFNQFILIKYGSHIYNATRFVSTEHFYTLDNKIHLLVKQYTFFLILIYSV